MIAPFSEQQLQLMQILVTPDHDAETLGRLREMLLAMYAADQISTAALVHLMRDLAERYRGDLLLAAMHEETFTLLKAAGRERTGTGPH